MKRKSTQKRECEEMWKRKDGDGGRRGTEI